ncbi:MAG: hypothetical protein ABSC38_04975 [Verrucomicrobiia bacterium]
MKPTDFHQFLTDVIDSACKFPKLWWGMLKDPYITLEKNLNSPNAHRLQPGAFLFINLLLSDILQAPSLLTPEHDNGCFSIALRESYSHIIGTLLLVFLLKLAFWQARPLKLFSMLCLSSVVFIPYTLVGNINSSLLGPIFHHYWVSFMSQHYDNYFELLRPTRSTVFKLVLSLALLSAVIIWWFRLMSIGCSLVSARSTRHRTVRLAAALSAYVVVFCGIVITVLCYLLWSSLTQFVNYDKMKDHFRSANYPEAYLCSASVTAAKGLPPVATYRACLIQALSYFKIWFKEDHSFDEAIEDIDNRNYSKAESVIRAKLHESVNSQTDTKRVAFASMQLVLDQAEKARNSPVYSEAETQSVLCFFSLVDIPVAFFP